MSGFSDWLAARAATRETAGLTRRLFASDTAGPMIDLAGNDYLGLSRDPRVVAGATKASEAYGAGAGASRLVTGTLSIHDQLEAALASFTGFPSALALSTGYHANLAVVAALADADTLIVSDAHVHASMIDACRLSRGAVQVVPHNDAPAVEHALANRTQPRAIVLIETIYSVLGDAAPVAELAAACARHDALLIADEAHALGVAGPGGRGLLHQADLTGQDHVVATLTLSKSLGSQGGAILASPAIRDHLINTARPFIYDTGLAPAAAGAALAALDVIADEPERVRRVLDVATTLADACEVDVPAGAVLAVPMPGPTEAVAAVAEAASQGVRIGCFRPPSTPDGISRLRLTAHAHLTDPELDRARTVLLSLR
ncbi:aminotransferase class I/II-fold pyridoxal phosphate-dependent enzyme [Nocardioides marmoriginsengisoli]|uniref:8-amino-7-oxononanoate synthase n=1 Tax=Nocardioides marmoriginsengisoli TaxID=661483 RepID=A0A3N0CRC0_9ACTN|nr:aminotransferase class I/II-fold pyridoxal phosphate-dependent enzyme [Nocardioides marmoriginsengisoli]RNL65821.1 aminotransferase class I/II-fold pyridoxal phosphate-dependent enzyme [Nocardioides marmoriginsengisoli]